MEAINFIDLNLTNVIILFIVGFIGGMVSGFIGSGGAFVLTPAMMSFGASGIVAVASNMAHKFPKALVGAMKRHKYGQVDIKLGIIMGIFAEIGVFVGKEIMTGIRADYGNAGTDLYVSFVFIVVLAIVGTFVFRDGIKMKREGNASGEHKTPKLAQWVQSIHIPGTMMAFKSIGNKKISLLFVAPMGFAHGLLTASLAVGRLIGLQATMYIMGVPAMMATATELVVAFIMGLGGSLFYAWEGYVDIRLAMIILAGSLFGVQIGAIGTTYVKEYTVKFVMGMIMLIVLLSRLIKLPVYLADLNMIAPLSASLTNALNMASFSTLALALLSGMVAITAALIKGIIEHRNESQVEHAMRDYEKDLAVTTADS